MGYKEPNEPFMDTPEPDEKGGSFHLKAPSEPLTQQKIKNFLFELEKLITHLDQLSRAHQHLLAQELQQTKNLLHQSDLSKEIVKAFEKLAGDFSTLLTHSAPLDREATLKDIQQILKLC